MYPDTTSYASVYNELDRLKRKPNEQISDFAIRITKVYAKLKNLAQEKLSDAWVEITKKETMLKNVPPNVRNFVTPGTDTYDELLNKILYQS